MEVTCPTCGARADVIKTGPLENKVSFVGDDWASCEKLKEGAGLVPQSCPDFMKAISAALNEERQKRGTR